MCCCPFYYYQVRCLFLTDGFIADNAQRDLIIQERSKYKDIELQPLQGWEFGLRFLSQIRWAFAKFDFQYFLRIDDDYFLCLKRLLAELPWRPKQNLVWGSFHCEAGITWIDESFMIFTPDIIDKFLSQNESTRLCHPHADQQIGIWLNDIPSRHLVHDSRLHHADAPASFSPQFVNVTNVCDSYLGIHGTYEDKMRYFGVNSNDSMKVESPFPDFSTFCQTKTFDYRIFNKEWKYQPKLCKDNPRWNVGRTIYVGRENRPPWPRAVNDVVSKQISVFNKIGRPRSWNPICNEVLFPINHKHRTFRGHKAGEFGKFSEYS